MAVPVGNSDVLLQLCNPAFPSRSNKEDAPATATVRMCENRSDLQEKPPLTIWKAQYAELGLRARQLTSAVLNLPCYRLLEMYKTQEKHQGRNHDGEHYMSKRHGGTTILIQVGDHLKDGWVLGLKTQRSHSCFELAPARSTPLVHLLFAKTHETGGGARVYGARTIGVKEGKGYFNLILRGSALHMSDTQMNTWQKS